jgi:hypothetical protein
MWQRLSSFVILLLQDMQRRYTAARVVVNLVSAITFNLRAFRMHSGHMLFV